MSFITHFNTILKASFSFLGLATINKWNGQNNKVFGKAVMLLGGALPR
jgi:hypothetical protein